MVYNKSEGFPRKKNLLNGSQHLYNTAAERMFISHPAHIGNHDLTTNKQVVFLVLPISSARNSRPVFISITTTKLFLNAS